MTTPQIDLPIHMLSCAYPRNAGVRWNSAVAEAYEQQQVCFSDGGLPHKYLLHVLDAELMTTKLASVGRHK